MSTDQTAPTPNAPSFEDYEDSMAESYERFFVPAIAAPLASRLVGRAALSPEERVLDVACGTGIVARLAAEEVGGAGRVAGVDVNPGMLTVARATAPPEADIAWWEGSAEAMPLPDEGFDVVLCQMGLQFVPDRVAAVAEMRRVLAAGGRVVLNVPGPTPEPMQIVADGLARHIGSEAAGFVHRVFSLHDPQEVEHLLADAGFADIEVSRETVSLELPSATEFLWQYANSTPLVEPVAAAEDAARQRLAADVAEGWKPFVVDGSPVLGVDVTTAVGYRR